RRRGGPHQEDAIDALQTSIERVGNSEVSAHHFNLWRQTSRVRFSRHGANLRARARQLRDNLPTNIACGADDADTIHAPHSIRPWITCFVFASTENMPSELDGQQLLTKCHPLFTNVRRH